MIRATNKFLATNASVNAGATAVDGVGFTSNEINLQYCRYASITLYVKGANASSAGTVTFSFVSYNDSFGAWDTVGYVTLTATLNGTADVNVTYPITPDISKIKLYSIANGDSSYGITANASLFMKDETE